ncbi:monooxygenase, partial [Acinetobacter baumannii]
AGLDAESLGSWLTRSRASAAARDRIAIAGRTTGGCEPEEISLLHVLHYIHQAGGLSSMLDTEGGAQEEHFVEGSHEIAARI